MAEASNTDWGQYFARIRKRCPWSYAAWRKGAIDVVPWLGVRLVLQPFEARIYRVNDAATAERLSVEFEDDEEYIWLFSHPDYGPNATPEPVLIQQDKAVLSALREQIGFEEEA